MKWMCLVAALLLTGAAHADEQCSLHEVSSFHLQKVANGGYAIPVTIMGKPQLMRVDVSYGFSYLNSEYGDAQGFHGPQPHFGGANPPKDEYEVPDFDLGDVQGKYVVFRRIKLAAAQTDGTIGGLGMDMLGRFDVELDLKNDKLTLFSQKRCPGKVVYWTSSPYAVINFGIDGIYHPYFLMDLDKKRISVSLTLQAGNARMSLVTAKRVFDIGEDSYLVSKVAVGSAGASVYRFPFKLLDMNGASIQNPTIDIDPKLKECSPGVPIVWRGREGVCYGGADLYLGQNELRKLRLFFAFGERKLYVTAADAH